MTVDPLTTPVRLYGSPTPAGGKVLDSDVAFIDDMFGSDPHVGLVVHSREFSGGDVDTWGVMMDSDLSNRRTIWSEVTTNWSTERPRCSHVRPGREDSWLVAFHRTLSSGQSVVRAYVHSRSNLALNSGRTCTLNTPSGLSHSRPVIGGTAGWGGSPNTCLVVFEERTTGASSAVVKGARFDPWLGRFGIRFHLAKASALNKSRRYPTITKHVIASATSGWIVAWQELSTNIANDDWDLYINRVQTDGTIGQEVPVGPHTSSNISATAPIVSGGEGRYMIAYGRRRIGSFDFQIGYQRFDWDRSAPSPTVQRERTISGGLTASPSLHGLAVDRRTTSHWAMVYKLGDRILARRLGYTGGTVESVTVHQFSSGVGAGGVDHCWQKGAFLLTYANHDFLYPLYGRYLEYDPNAAWSNYGSSCASGASFRSYVEPYAGHGRFWLSFSPPSSASATMVFLLAGALPGSLRIPGTNGCLLLLDRSTVFVVDGKRARTPTEFRIPLPDDPVFRGNIRFQIVFLAPGVNPLGLQTTQGMLVEVR